MITQLGHVTVVVKDLSRSLRFFRDKVGLHLAFFDRKNDWVCFDCGRTAFSLTTPYDRESKKLIGRRTGVSFYVDDMDRTVKALKKKKVKISVLPVKQPWGGVIAAFEDLDRNRFFLVQMPAGFDK